MWLLQLFIEFYMNFYLVGISTRQSDYLKFLFEMNEEFTVLPTYAVIPLLKCNETLLEVPDLNINPAMVS